MLKHKNGRYLLSWTTMYRNNSKLRQPENLKRVRLSTYHHNITKLDVKRLLYKNIRVYVNTVDIRKNPFER